MSAELTDADRTVTDVCPEYAVYTTFHFPENAANVVTTEQTDWASDCPEYKVAAVEVTPSHGMSEWQRRYVAMRERQQQRPQTQTETAASES